MTGELVTQHYFGKRDLPLTGPTNFAAGANPFSVAIGDVNEDGAPDMLVTNYGSNTVSVLLGTGAGSFGAATNFAVGINPTSVAIGDVNGDGKLDMLVTNAGSNDVSVLLGSGTGTFSVAIGSPVTVGNGPQTMALGDVNGDGKLDMVVVNIGSNDVSVLLGSGTGTFTAAISSPVTVGANPQSVALGDVNGDGKLDMVVANSVSNNVSVLLGSGTGTFSAASGSPVTVGLGPLSVAISDVNGDGKPDMVVANFNSNNVSVLLGSGTGTFFTAIGSPVPVGIQPYSVAIGDVNGDGKPDMMVANAGSNDVSVLLGSGTGTFTAAIGSPVTVGSGPQSVVIGDVNGDGAQDALVVNTNSNNVSVLLGTPVFCSLTFSAATNFAVGTNPFSVAIADVNGDGKLDIVAANNGANNVSALLGTGTGSFGAVTNFAVGTNPRSVAIADVDGDGKLDVVVANANSNDVSVFLGMGTGSFGVATNFAVGNNPFSVAIADVNGDGKLDMLVANFNSNNVSVLLGTGTGSFGAVTNFAVSTNPRSVAIADVNGDGKLDMLVANANLTNNVSVLLGNGAGSFGAATDFATGLSPFSVAIADVDGDGKLDVVVANQNSNDVSVLLGNGAGSFGAATNFAVGAAPTSVALADVNGDGKLDMLVANVASSDVSVLLGTGTGSFGAATNFAAGANTVSVAIADVNGDGKLDVVTANQSSNDISVLFGQCTSPSPTASLTPSSSLTPSGSISVSTSESPSSSVSVMPSSSVSGTASSTPSSSLTASSITVTSSASITLSQSLLPTSTISETASVTASETASVSLTPASSLTATLSETPTVSLSASPSQTASVSETASITITPSSSVTGAASSTPSSSLTPSMSETTMSDKPIKSTLKSLASTPTPTNNQNAALNFEDSGFNGDAAVQAVDSQRCEDLEAFSTAAIGDFNGDGLSDYTFGAPGGKPKGREKAGYVSVIYRQKARSGDEIERNDVTDIRGRLGFTVEGAHAGDQAGYAIAGAGDVNGDGLADMLIGAPFATRLERIEAGTVTLIWGTQRNYKGVLDLKQLTAKQGITIIGASAGDHAGFSVSAAGDVNGDGQADIQIGAPDAGSGGKGYVVYGRKEGFPAVIDLKEIKPEEGMILIGEKASGRFGLAVSGAGKVNQDKLDDILIGAPIANSAYLIYGDKNLPATLSMKALTAKTGCHLEGEEKKDRFGSSVSGDGDVNGDGQADMVIGAPSASPDGRKEAGTVYIIYGSNTLPDRLTMDKLSKSEGSILRGDKPCDHTGAAVSTLLSKEHTDIVIGAPDASINGKLNSGRAYIVRGENSNFKANSCNNVGSAQPLPRIVELGQLTAREGYKIDGTQAGQHIGFSVGGVGDVDGKGDSNLLIGAVAECGKIKPHACQKHHDAPELSGASRLSPGIDVKANVILGVVLAKMMANAYEGIVSALSGCLNKLQNPVKLDAAKEALSAEQETDNILLASRLETRYQALHQQIQTLLRQPELDKWLRYMVEDIQDGMKQDKYRLSQAQLEEWEETLVSLQAEYKPEQISITAPATPFFMLKSSGQVVESAPLPICQPQELNTNHSLSFGSYS